jgi:hypothetical protein
MIKKYSGEIVATNNRIDRRRRNKSGKKNKKKGTTTEKSDHRNVNFNSKCFNDFGRKRIKIIQSKSVDTFITRFTSIPRLTEKPFVQAVRIAGVVKRVGVCFGVAVTDSRQVGSLFFSFTVAAAISSNRFRKCCSSSPGSSKQRTRKSRKRT